MKDIIAEMKPKTQSIIRGLFANLANGGNTNTVNGIMLKRHMDAYINKLEKEGLIKYQHIVKGGLCVGITLTSKGLDACLNSKCTRDIRELPYGVHPTF